MLISSSCLGSSPISVDSMNTYVHPVGEIRLAKNTYGSDFHLLSAGSNRAYHLLIPLYEERESSQEPSLSPFGEGFMKDILTIFLASVFVLFSLIVLLSAASTSDRTSSTLDNDQQRVSDLGLRFAFKR